MEDWHALDEAIIETIDVDSAVREVRIDVTLRSDEAMRRRIVARGVDDFVVLEMRMMNIIERVTRLAAADGKEAETAARLFFLMRGREPAAEDLKWPVLLEKLERVRAGALTFIEIEPVYGATVLLLAERIQLEHQ